MFDVILHGIWARRWRALLTATGVLLGVAMISGTFVLMDTVMAGYANIFKTAYVHTDAVVVAESPFGALGATKQPVPATLLDTIRALPDVDQAFGIIDAKGQLTTADGAALGFTSEEANVFGIPSSALGSMNPLHLITGTWPTGPGQIIIDEATANSQNLTVGTTVGLVARRPLERYQVVGTFRFANAATLGPVQFVAVDLAVAQRIFDKQEMLDEIDIAARPGVADDQLLQAIRAVLPNGTTVNSAAQQVNDATSDVARSYALVRYALLAFGATALFVGSFIIFNTMSITVAQRTRELATLRTLGASRRQVLWSILIEGGLLGVTASAVGLGVGVGLAKGLDALFGAAGIDLPAAGTVVTGRTAVVGLCAGIAVTLIASAVPALRAMRIAPIAAIRDGDASGSTSRLRAALPTAVAGLIGAGLLLPALTIDGLSTTRRLMLLAGGALFVFIGIAGASRWVVAPLAVAIERPFERFTHGTGELAREDAVRSPARTATTAAALTVGVALIAFVTVISQGLQSSTATSINHQIQADYVITSQFDVLAPDIHRALTAAGIENASVRSGAIHVLDTTQTMTGVDPADINGFYQFDWEPGSSQASLQSLDDNSVLVTEEFATAHHLDLGTTITVLTTSGATLDLVIEGIYTSPKQAPLLGTLTVTTNVFDANFTTPADRAIYVQTGGTGPAALASLSAALTPFPTAKINTLGEFITINQATTATLLNLFYVLLALCVVISLLGIINTLALSITERTREIGVMRAIGMTRTQLRRMIRIESELIALIGAVIGIAAGLLLAAVTAQALSAWAVAFTIPWTTLAILLAGAFVSGTLAGIGPARRAARLDPLTALTYE